ncbi:hypothetical protein [Agarivorans gilvus]|uniref:Uncharacterized protein n=1 Tax=Agarivorans gilvus TaxID=680279 RepID=A0ABQ1I7X7_9ALTE|nr:hypothetical protein [Agarivorans gilvus]GGB22063.1 hypothetical protein GCM10007414_39310 [Agarivorans gilvus]
MHEFKILNVVVVLGLSFVSASCSAAAECSKEVFGCFTSQPKPLTMKLCESSKGYYLEQFIVDGEQLGKVKQQVTLFKTSYHRSMVDEHSVEFQILNTKVIVSDYHSEELGEIIDELSVTVIENGEKKYFECEGKSFSGLSSLENTSK